MQKIEATPARQRNLARKNSLPLCPFVPVSAPPVNKPRFCAASLPPVCGPRCRGSSHTTSRYFPFHRAMARCGSGTTDIFRPPAESALPSREVPPPPTPPPTYSATCRRLQDGPLSSSPSPISLPWSIPGNPANFDLRNQPRHQVG